MKIEIDMSDILDSWVEELRTSYNGPSDATIGPVVMAICDVCHNYYQAASFLIDGAFDSLPEKDIANVLEEHGYQKIAEAKE